MVVTIVVVLFVTNQPRLVPKRVVMHHIRIKKLHHSRHLDGKRYLNPHDPNFTCGAVLTASASPSPSSKKISSWKPKGLAIRLAGNCWIAVLYSAVALLKKRRAAAILFS